MRVDFDAFYREHRDGLVRLCFLTTLDVEVAADAAQEAMLRAFRRWATLQYEMPLAWVRRVAMNLCRSRWRRAQRELHPDALPLSVVLDSQVSSTPSGWQSITFGGLQFAVPATWDISRFSWWGGCPGNLEADRLELSTAETFSAPGCPGPPSTADYLAGVSAMVVGSGPKIPAVAAGARCFDRNGLRICIDPPPNPTGGYEPGHELNILTAQVSVPGQTNLDQIEIGLSGDGTQALNIFDSLRPAP